MKVYQFSHSFLAVFVILCLSFCSVSVFGACPVGDLNGDCKVDFTDFALMSQNWLDEGIQEIVWVSINNQEFNGQMSKYETTNAQYCQYLNAALDANQITVYNDIVYATTDTNHTQSCFLTAPAFNYSQITYSNGTFSVRSRDNYSMENHPVVMVTWYGATAFCNYYGYRLPTNSEWQAVASYYHTQNYGCGTSIDSTKANYNSNNPLGLTSYPYTTPVGRYPSYGYGMNDMAGNVWEWTSSFIGDHSQYILCGGSWFDYDSNCSYSSWISFDPYDTYMYAGFRACKN